MKLYLIGSTFSNLNVGEIEKEIPCLSGDTLEELLGDLVGIRSGKWGIPPDEFIVIFTPEKIPYFHKDIKNPEKWIDMNEEKFEDQRLRVCYIFPEMTQNEIIELMKDASIVFVRR